MLGVVDSIAEEYLESVRIKDSFISATCPFHKSGQEAHPSFWLNRYSGEWGCFTCSAKGSDLKYLLRDLGVRNLKAEAEIEEAAKHAKKTLKVQKLQRLKRARADFKGTHTLPDSLLGVFDWTPTSLVEAGYSEEVLMAHDIGFDRRLDRITFPVRDIHGNLVGISGRTVHKINPKYLFYSGRRIRNGEEVLGELGEWYPEYSNEDVRNHLWRGHIVYPRLIKSTKGQMIVVEGFKAALYLVQLGWENTVATMGTAMTLAQERIIRRIGLPTFVLMDNNQPGREAARDISQRLASSTFPVYRCEYPGDCDPEAQPDDLAEEEVEAVLANSKRAGGKRYGRMGNSRTSRLPEGSKVFRRKEGR